MGNPDGPVTKEFLEFLDSRYLAFKLENERLEKEIEKLRAAKGLLQIQLKKLKEGLDACDQYRRQGNERRGSMPVISTGDKEMICLKNGESYDLEQLKRLLETHELSRPRYDTLPPANSKEWKEWYKSYTTWLKQKELYELRIGLLSSPRWRSDFNSPIAPGVNITE